LDSGGEVGETSAEEEPPGDKPAGEAQNKVEFDAMSLAVFVLEDPLTRSPFPQLVR
jgi:hypothetical protein